MIRVDNLLKKYGDITALDHLSLEVNEGIIFGLLGPNGAGKTTLVSILNGLSDFQGGSVDIFGLPLRENLRSIRQRCSLVPQTLALYENLTVIENLRFFAGVQNIRGDSLKENIAYAIEVNHLEPLLDQKASTISGGQKRRLNIAAGLLNDPDILFFDEPTVGIDPEARNEILETIVSFKERGKTIIYTSHYMPEIEKICDEVAIIDRGKIVAQGTLEKMLSQEESSSAIIEIYETPIHKLEKIVSSHKGLSIIDGASLKVENQNSDKMALTLKILESESIKIRQIRYGTTNLESLFIRLTSHRGEV
ncbi:MAG: ABC transporter ATP-binding protein [Campylobacterota bacterium]|nr:ABC transporter ATP-binding protein [Campylobacterota bacterium]